MKQLEFNFEALPEVVEEIKKVVSTSVPRLSMAEVRECWQVEQMYNTGGRIDMEVRAMLAECERERKQERELDALLSSRYSKIYKRY